MMDLGSVHERSTAIFTITLAQYTPAAVHGEEDRVMVRPTVFMSTVTARLPAFLA